MSLGRWVSSSRIGKHQNWPTVIGTLCAALAVIFAGYAVYSSTDSEVDTYVSKYVAPTTTIPPVIILPTPIAFAKPGDRPTRVLFTGDSLTGSLYSSTTAKGFVALVTGALGNVDRMQASRAKETLLTTVSSISDVPPNLDLAIVELGKDDISEKTPIALFSTQYGALLDRLRATSPKTALVCVGIWSGAVQQPTYDNVIKQQCIAKAGMFVSTFQYFQITSNRGPVGVTTATGLSDDFHPNDTGHQKIAGAIIKTLGL